MPNLQQGRAAAYAAGLQGRHRQKGPAALSAKGWARAFDQPIRAGRRELVTLRDAGEYIAALPVKEARALHWQVAMQCLIDAADRDGILMLADIAIRRALAKDKPAPQPEPRRRRSKTYQILR
jgi:hypothetical protein